MHWAIQAARIPFEFHLSPIIRTIYGQPLNFISESQSIMPIAAIYVGILKTKSSDKLSIAVQIRESYPFVYVYQIFIAVCHSVLTIIAPNTIYLICRNA